MKQAVSLVLALVALAVGALAFSAPAQAHRVDWQTQWAYIFANPAFNGLCGQGLNWVCAPETAAHQDHWPTGDHSRWITGGFREYPVEPWKNNRWCNVMVRYYHLERVETGYKNCF